MKNIEKAYLAALVDGEGYISIIKDINGYHVVIGIDNTCLQVLLWVKKVTKIGYVIAYKPGKGHFGKKQLYAWKCSHIKAMQLIKLIEPYMIIKRNKAKIALKFPTIKRGFYGCKKKPLKYDKIRESLKRALQSC